MKWMIGLGFHGALLLGLWTLSACSESVLPRPEMAPHTGGTPSSYATGTGDRRASAIAPAGLPAVCLDGANRLAAARRSVPADVPVAALPPDLREQLRWRGRVLDACLMEAAHQPIDAGPEADPATAGVGR